MTEMLTVTATGQVCLPDRIRLRLGVAAGGTLLIEEIENGIILRTLENATTLANDSDNDLEGSLDDIAQRVRVAYPPIEASAFDHEV